MIDDDIFSIQVSDNNLTFFTNQINTHNDYRDDKMIIVVVVVFVLPVDFDLIEMYKPVCCCKMDEVE